MSMPDDKCLGVNATSDEAADPPTTLSHFIWKALTMSDHDAGNSVVKHNQSNWPISQPGQMSPYDLALPPFNLPKPTDCIKTHAVRMASSWLCCVEQPRSIYGSCVQVHWIEFLAMCLSFLDDAEQH